MNAVTNPIFSPTHQPTHPNTVMPMKMQSLFMFPQSDDGPTMFILIRIKHQTLLQRQHKLLVIEAKNNITFISVNL